MTSPGRIGVLVLVVALAAAYLAWNVYGAWPVPAGYEFPRHSMWGGGPTALFRGTLANRHGCIETASGSTTIVWPPGSWLSIENGEPIVHVSGRTLHMGEQIALGGGDYSRTELARIASGAAKTPCPEPFFLTTGIAD